MAPRYKLGERVRIVIDDAREDLRHRVGVIADPGPHLRGTKPRWPDTYWKLDPPGSRRIVYWIDFGTPGPSPGDLCAAEVDEDHLTPA